jgi:DNA-binding NtrC family response regulator
MSPIDGMSILRYAKRKDPNTQVLMMTAFATIETAIEALKAGAFDYVVKPFKLDNIKLFIRRALEHRATIIENDNLKEILKQKYDFKNIIGESSALRNVIQCVQKVAATDATVLITGESGTGKELFAKAIFANSNRQNMPFVSINCGAMVDTLLESELFGHVKGSFTDASSDKKGLFQVADGGTIFLDEIGLTSKSFQMKLLRVLQEREIRRVGDTRDIKVDVRIIAATNENLEEKVKNNSFREDLYYRLSVFPILLPPLRKRTGDIPLLIKYFLDKSSTKLGKTFRPDKEFVDILSKYNWPGNIRELENIIERSVLLAESTTIKANNLPDSLLDFNNFEKAGDDRELRAVIDDAQRNHILRVLEETNGNKKLASRILDIDPATLYRKMEKLGLE